MAIIKTINPYNQQTIKEYETLSIAALNHVLTKSKKAFTIWQSTTFETRSNVLKKAANILRRDKEKLSTLITTEMGKAIVESRAEVEKCATALDYYATYGETYLENQMLSSSAKTKSYVMFQPIGTILAIMPWNYPFWQVIRYAAPCIISGNVTILKHAPNVFGCGHAIENIFLEAGLIEGAFQSIVIDIDLIEQVVAHDTVQGLTFTGSEMAGANVAMLAGKHIKKSVLELGGSDPFIVLDDADIALAAKTASASRMMNAGQACICAKRFIVTQKVKDDFQEYFLNEIKKIKIGNPLDETVTMGTMARLDLAKKIEIQAQSSIAQGGKVLIGAERNNCFYMPTLMINIKKGMKVYDEEIFGPLASLIVVSDEKEAVRVANDTPYGLGASVWSNDLDKAQRVASQIEAGGIFINASVHSDPRLPFGGIKKSGYGRELSEVGIKEFMNVKTIYIN